TAKGHRQRRGIAAGFLGHLAQARHKSSGPLEPAAQQQVEARKRRSEGATLKELAQSCNIGVATISRLSSRYRDSRPKGSLSCYFRSPLLETLRAQHVFQQAQGIGKCAGR